MQSTRNQKTEKQVKIKYEKIMHISNYSDVSKYIYKVCLAVLVNNK